jgi:hypothetical protein
MTFGEHGPSVDPDAENNKRTAGIDKLIAEGAVAKMMRGLEKSLDSEIQAQLALEESQKTKGEQAAIKNYRSPEEMSIINEQEDEQGKKETEIKEAIAQGEAEKRMETEISGIRKYGKKLGLPDSKIEEITRAKRERDLPSTSKTKEDGYKEAA